MRAIGWNVIGDGDNSDAAPPQASLVELRVVELAGKAREGPEDQAVRKKIFWEGSGQADHRLELIAPSDAITVASLITE